MSILLMRFFTFEYVSDESMISKDDPKSSPFLDEKSIPNVTFCTKGLGEVTRSFLHGCDMETLV